MIIPTTRIAVEEIVDEKAEIVTVRVTDYTRGEPARSAAGTAKTASPDKFDIEIGRKIARGRALRNLGRQILSEGQDEVHARDKVRRSQEEASQLAREAKQARRAAFPKEQQEGIYAVSTTVTTPAETPTAKVKKKRIRIGSK